MRVLLASTVLTCALLGAASPARAQQSDSMNVLFVGNSYTRFHDMTDTVVLLARDLGVRMQVRLAFVAGATLGDHFRRRTALRLLRRGDFTHLVLQGHSLDALERPRSLRRYAERFDAIAQAAEMDTILYQTWARAPESVLYERGVLAESPEEMQDEIASVYRGIADHLDADVAPVGAAFLIAQHEHPELRLHWPDASHPTRLGSYLAALVLCGRLTGIDPAQTRYVPPGVEDEEAAVMRVVASAVLR